MSQSQPQASFARPGASAGKALLLPALLAFALAYGCRCSGDAPPAATSEAEARAACRAACATYVGAKCPARAGTQLPEECVNACLGKSRVSSEAGCRPARLAYLDCLGRATVECSEVLSSSSAALELGEGTVACSNLRAELERCAAPCLHAGSVHLGEASLEGKPVSAELVRDGCSDCASKAAAGAPVGSPCQVASVCAQYCCDCTGSKAHYRARACVAGTCADSAQACAVAPAAAQHDVCPRVKP